MRTSFDTAKSFVHMKFKPMASPNRSNRKLFFLRFLAFVIASVLIILFLNIRINPLNWNAKENDQLSTFSETLPEPNQSANSDFFTNLAKSDDSVAICIDGDAELFDLTGPTMLTHLVNAYSDSAIFLSVRLSQHAHKLSIFSKLHNLATVHLVPESSFPETVHAKAIFSSHSSEALQVQLNQLSLVENCLSLILKHEKKYGMQFKWIMRARLDSFWSSKPPLLKRLHPDKYSIPPGSRFGGLNDRFGMGGRRAAMAALKKLSYIPDINMARLGGGNSETTLLHQLKLKKVEVQFIKVYFCLLSKSVYSWPLFPLSIPVTSISSEGAMNGARCRPCAPEAVGNYAEEQLSVLKPQWGSIGSRKGIDLCNANHPWGSDWRRFYANAVGEQNAAIAKRIERRKGKRCVKENMALISVTANYRGPPAVILCLLNRLNEAEVLGKKEEGWFTFVNALDSKSTVYSVGLDYDLSWEEQLFSRTSAQIHLFDATPSGVPAVQSRKDRLSSLFKLHNWCMAAIDGRLEFNSMIKWGNSDVLYTSLPFPVPPFEFIDRVQGFPSKRLHTSMKRLGHTKVDILKMNVAGSEFSIILEDWALLENPLPVCQLLIRFSEEEVGHRGEFLRSRSMDVLKSIGMHLIKCGGKPGSHRCVFLSSQFCL